MSGDRSSPRFDVVASTRRQFSRDQKRAIVAKVERGATVSEVARRHSIHSSLLFRWRRDLAAVTPQPSTPQFLPVSIDTPPAAVPAPPVRPATTEIELASGRKLRVASDIDVAALRRIIVALETA